MWLGKNLVRSIIFSCSNISKVYYKYFRGEGGGDIQANSYNRMLFI